MNGHLTHPHLLGLARHSADELMPLVRQGDALAFEALYYQMRPVLANFLRARPWIAAAAEDVVQEVLCRIWERRAALVITSGSAKSYLISVALNVAREHYRARAQREGLLDDGAELIVAANDATEGALNAELGQSLRTARAGLSQNQQAAVKLVYDDQLDAPQAAGQLGCSQQALRRRLQEARRKLYAILAQQE